MSSVSPSGKNTKTYSDWAMHVGKRFFIRNYVSVPKTTVARFLIISPDDYEIEMHCDIETDFPVTVAEYEGTAYSVIGTPGVPICRDRANPGTSRLQVYAGPTVAALGTLLRQCHLALGKSTGGTLEGDPVVLKHNTVYSLIITANDTDDCIVNYHLDWIERKL